MCNSKPFYANKNLANMKYIVRAIKYFLYFSILCAAMVTVLALIGAVEGNIDSIFQEGYRSVGKIAIFFAVVAAVYPKLGFITRGMAVTGSWDEIREKTVSFMKERHYELESESPEKVTFRLKGVAGKLSKMYEDRLTFISGPEGWTVEGLRKDVMRITSGLEHLMDS